MEVSIPLALDAAGQPVLQHEEVHYRMQDGIDIHDREEKTPLRRGLAMLTSHRLCWIDADRKQPVSWHLGHVVATHVEEGRFLVGSSKIVVRLRGRVRVTAASGGALPAGGGGYPSLPAPVSLDAASLAETHIKLAFKEGGRDAFLEDLNRVLNRRSWVPQPTAAPAVLAQTRMAEIVSRPGVAGILERRERAQEQSKELATTAFTDLAELEKHAKSLVQLAESYAAEAAARARSVAAGSANSPATGTAAGSGGAASPASTGSEGGVSRLAAELGQSNLAAAATDGSDQGKPGEREQFGDLVATLGIVNPVTRSACGTGSGANQRYFVEVARQLASFTRPRLERCGGLMALTDAYCLYNRARGTDLISPEDLLQAAGLLATLTNPAVGMRRRTFPSGLIVLQLDSFSEEGAANRIARELTARKGEAAAAFSFVSAMDVATAWGQPIQVAQQLLLASESRGLLCRDDTIHGLRFYLNLFPAISSAAKKALSR